ncbi:MAG: TIGR01777 family oxidoreductase [Bacteroidota bacterium]
MNILITGGTGFIGSYLVPTLTQAGHQVTILSRSQRKSEDRLLTYLQWTGKEMPQGIGMYDAIINLAGASIGGDKWTDAQKKLIIDSRVDATRACVNYINSSPNPPQVFISASGVGYYGSDVTTPVDESGALGDDFPAKVVKIWEEEANKAECRTVTPRIGVVLETDGGALERMLPLFKMYLGGRFADGKQGFPWVHMQDIVKAFHFS